METFAIIFLGLLSICLVWICYGQGETIKNKNKLILAMKQRENNLIEDLDKCKKEKFQGNFVILDKGGENV